MKLDDQFEWDIENVDPTPEQFAEIYGTDLGLTGEFKYVPSCSILIVLSPLHHRTAIAHSIREQVATYQKSLLSVHIVSLAFRGLSC